MDAGMQHAAEVLASWSERVCEEGGAGEEGDGPAGSALEAGNSGNEKSVAAGDEPVGVRQTESKGREDKISSGISSSSSSRQHKKSRNCENCFLYNNKHCWYF